MMISLGVLVLPVVAIMFIARSCTAAASPTIDASNYYAGASRSFAVVQPRPVPAGWRTVSAVLMKGVGSRRILRIGFSGPDGGVAQLVEGSSKYPTIVKEELAGGLRKPLGVTDIKGMTWERYPGRGGQLAFVSRRGGVIVVLSGSAPVEELERLAGSLT
jgi:hypothetical protein